MNATQKRYDLALLAALIVTNLCSVFDLGFTLYALEHVPHAFEMNPFFRLLLASPALLYVYKFGVLPLALWVMYKARTLRLARFGLWLCTAAFTVNTVYQLWSIQLW